MTKNFIKTEKNTLPTNHLEENVYFLVTFKKIVDIQRKITEFQQAICLKRWSILNGTPQTSLPASPPSYPTDTPALARPPHFPRAFLTLHFVFAFPLIVILVLEIPLQRSPLSRSMFLNSLGWFRALPSWTSMPFPPLSWSHLVIGL